MTEAVRKKPYSIILFDEFEKAHREVSNLLLQLLDDGVLTDSKGVKVDFKNTIIVMTSNIGANFLANNAFFEDANAGSGTSFHFFSFHFFISLFWSLFLTVLSGDFLEGGISKRARGEVMNALRAAYPPEFLNRIDDVVIFNRLSKENMTGIVDVRVTEIEKLLEPRKVKMVITPEAKKWLSDEGYDAAYGARPLNRVISKEILNPMARYILEGAVRAGDVITLGASPSTGLNFTKTAPDGTTSEVHKIMDKWSEKHVE